MKSTLSLYNTLSRRKERFEPLEPPFVGLYVCGPTVYGDPHLGHARPAVTFDLLFRYLKATGYKVRYVRNITDVGHLEHDADEGEDKIAKKARLEQLEPMEVAQYYTDRYHDAMRALNVLPPSIEPRASGHIIEQIEMTKAGTVRFRAVEKSLERAYHALAVSVERRIPRLAYGVLRDEYALLGRDVRHTRGRHGPDVPASRMRDRAEHGRLRPRLGPLLDAQ